MNTLRTTSPLILGLACLAQTGCVESQSATNLKPFETDGLDSALVIVVDMSGSFGSHWDESAYETFLGLCDQYFTHGAGSDSRIVIAQLSGNDNAVLFEGRPSELRSAFGSPEELSDFLRDKSNPYGSKVYQATGQAISYVNSMPRVTDQTRLMTAIFSDLVDSEGSDPERNRHGVKMLSALKRYRELGGGLALYYVSEDETTRWSRILERAGFEPGSFLIQSRITAKPQLPTFD